MHKDLTTEINRAAHSLAQQQYEIFRGKLRDEAKAMRAEGKTTAEILAMVMRATDRR